VTASPSGSCAATVAVSVSPVSGEPWSIATESTTGAEFATSAEADASVPVSVPSDGVTSTATTWPLSPLPACERSSVSTVDEVPEVVLTVVPSTFQT